MYLQPVGSYVDRFLDSKVGGSWINILKSCITPITSYAVIYPLRTVRARLAFTIGEEDKKYEGVIDCLKTIYKEEGFSALYKGFDVRVLRIILRQTIIAIGEMLVIGSGISDLREVPSSFVVQL